MAKDFVEQFEIPYPVYTDPAKKTYDFMGFKRSFGLGLSSMWTASRALRKGHVQGATRGDVWQQGGEGLFACGGELLWSHSAKKSGEHASTTQLLAAIDLHFGQQSHRNEAK